MFAWKVTHDGIAFPDSALAISGDEARRNVHQGWPFHPSRESNHILRADNVRTQGTFKCGIERDVAGAVDDDVDVVGNSLSVIFGVAQIGIADISTQHGNLAANKPVTTSSARLVGSGG